MLIKYYKWYKIKKWVRRNKIIANTLFTTIIILLLLLFIV